MSNRFAMSHRFSHPLVSDRFPVSLSVVYYIYNVPQYIYILTIYIPQYIYILQCILVLYSWDPYIIFSFYHCNLHSHWSWLAHRYSLSVHVAIMRPKIRFFQEIIANEQLLISKYFVHVDPYCNQCKKNLKLM